VINYKIDDQDSGDNSLHSLNPDHTHFIIVDDEKTHVDLLKFRVALEKRLQKPVLSRKVKSLPVDNNETRKQVIESEASHDKIPIVSLLIGGGIVSVNLV
jgi:hypothetical protein